MLNIGWELRKLPSKTKTFIILHKNHLSRHTPRIAEKMVVRPDNRWSIRSTLGEAVDSWLIEPRRLAIPSHLTTTSWPLPNVDEKLWASHPQMGGLQLGIPWGRAPQSPHSPETQQVFSSVLSQGGCQKPDRSSTLPLSFLTLFLHLLPHLSPQLTRLGNNENPLEKPLCLCSHFWSVPEWLKQACLSSRKAKEW